MGQLADLYSSAVSGRFKLLVFLAFVVLPVILTSTPSSTTERRPRWEPLSDFPVDLSHDLDRDGVGDAVTLREQRLVIDLAEDSAADQVQTLKAPVAVAAGDVDADGDADLLVLLDRGALQLWSNDGAGHFTAGIVLSRSVRPPVAVTTVSIGWTGEQTEHGPAIATTADGRPALPRVHRYRRPGIARGERTPHVVGVSPPSSIDRSSSPRAPPASSRSRQTSRA